MQFLLVAFLPFLGSNTIRKMYIINFINFRVECHVPNFLAASNKARQVFCDSRAYEEVLYSVAMFLNDTLALFLANSPCGLVNSDSFIISSFLCVITA